MRSTLEKQSVACMTGKQSILKIFKALTSTNHASAVTDHMTMKGHRIKCKIKEILLIRENVGSEKLLLY